MSKLLIVGANGQLGTDMVKLTGKRNIVCKGIDFPDIDITKTESVRAVIDTEKPTIIINCAAFTAVDDCEKKKEIAFKVNADGCGILAQESQRVKAKLIHISTDYVFDGTKNTPYVESDVPSPATEYGKSKLDGEQQIAKYTENYQIYRIAWLYGLYGNNFVKTIRNAALKKQGTGDGLKVVNDQYGSPTWTVDVCNQILAAMNLDLRGVFHCTSEGSCTWYDFAKAIVGAYGINTSVNACTTDEYPRPAPRPKFSVLENERLKKEGVNIMPHWKDAFNSYISHEKTIQ
ncbi:MAG: dTDP-4-dehydrorhamnose reductase [Fibrobacterota bacterium]